MWASALPYLSVNTDVPWTVGSASRPPRVAGYLGSLGGG